MSGLTESSVVCPPQNQYKADLSFMKGVAWDGVGAPQMESAKKAGELLSEVRMGESGSRRGAAYMHIWKLQDHSDLETRC